MGNVVFKLEGEEANAVRAFLKVVDAQKKTEDQTGKTNRALKDQGSGLGEITSRIASFASASFIADTAMRGLTAAMAEMAATRKRAADAAISEERSLAKLVNFGAEGFKDRLAGVRASQATMPAASAAALQAVLADMGMESDRVMFAKTYKLGYEPAELAESVGKIRASYGEAAGTPEQVLSDLLRATGAAGSEPGEVGPMLASMATTATAIGASFKDVLAAFTVLEDSFKSPKETASALGSYMSGLEKMGSRSGLFRSAASLEGRSDAQIKKLLGENGRDAFARIVGNKDEIRQALQSGRVLGSPELDRRLGALRSDPLIAATQDLNATKAAAAGVERDTEALGELKFQELRERVLAELRANGEDAFSRLMIYSHLGAFEAVRPRGAESINYLDALIESTRSKSSGRLSSVPIASALTPRTPGIAWRDPEEMGISARLFARDLATETANTQVTAENSKVLAELNQRILELFRRLDMAPPRAGSPVPRNE